MQFYVESLENVFKDKITNDKFILGLSDENVSLAVTNEELCDYLNIKKDELIKILQKHGGKLRVHKSTRRFRDYSIVLFDFQYQIKNAFNDLYPYLVMCNLSNKC